MDRLVLQLQIQPGARRTQVVGLHGDRLKIALLAPPVDGQANDALLRFLGKQLGVGRSAVELLRGMSSREKTVAIRGDATDAAAWIAQLEALAGPQKS